MEKKLVQPVEIWRRLHGRNSRARLTKKRLWGRKAVLAFSYGVHHGFVCSHPIAPYHGYAQHERFVPESAEFQAFDLGALRHSYNAEDNSPSRPFNRKKSFVIQA